MMSGLSFLCVAMLWGCTNPFLKRGSEGVNSIQASNKFVRVVYQLKWLALNFQFTVPFLINQAGSVLYFITVAQSDISLAVPIINSLTLAITAIVGMLLGEKIQSTKSYFGMFCIIIGVCIALLSKS